jgi:hypothetical protein
MSQTAIGKAALVLSTESTQMKTGLDAAGKDVQTWGQRTADRLKGVFAGGMMGGMQNLGGAVAGGLVGLAAKAKGLLGAAGTGIGFALGGPIGAAIGGAVGSAVGTLGETVAGALAAPFDKINEFAAVSKRATSLGINASQYQGLTKQLGLVGIEGDQTNTILAKLGKTISSGGDFENPAALATFERIGLNAHELSQMPLDQAFLKISTAISKLPSPMEQTNASLSIFGRQMGTQLLPVLQKGGAGIQDFIEQQKKFGGVLSDSQLQAAGNASKAWKQAKQQIATAWDGLVNRATLIAAPLIQFAGKFISKVFALATPVFDWIGRAVSKVADIVTAVFEVLEKWVDDAVGWLSNLGQQVFGFAGTWPTVEQVVVAVFRAIGTAAAYVWDSIKLGAGVVAVAFGAIIEYGGTTLSMFRNLVDVFKKAADAMGVKDQKIDQVVAMVDGADDKVKGWGKAMKEWGANAVTGFGDSAKQFNSWLDRALGRQKQAAKEGKAALAEVGAAAGVLDKLKSDNRPLIKGTSAEVSARIKHDFAGKIQEQQLAEVKKGNGLLKEVRDAVQGLGGLEGPALLSM